MASDSRFGTNAKRVENRFELIEILSERVRRRPVAEWVEKLSKSGLPCSRVNTIREAFDEPQTEVRQMIQEIDCSHSNSGKIHLTGMSGWILSFRLKTMSGVELVPTWWSVRLRVLSSGTPIKLSQSPLVIRSAPPALGEHSKEILAELGFVDEQVEQLIKDSVI